MLPGPTFAATARPGPTRRHRHEHDPERRLDQQALGHGPPDWTTSIDHGRHGIRP